MSTTVTHSILNHSDSSFRIKAKRYSLHIAALIQENNYLAGCQFALSCGIDIPCKNYPDLRRKWQAAQQQYVLSAHDAEHPIHRKIQQLKQQWQPIKARLLDEQWWTRQLIKQHDRRFEHAAIHIGKCV